MPAQPAELNTDTNGVKTSAYYTGGAWRVNANVVPSAPSRTAATVLASASRSGTGNSAATDVTAYRSASFGAACTTGSVTVAPQMAPASGGPWCDVGAAATLTAGQSIAVSVPSSAPFVRWRYDTGGPTATFEAWLAAVD